MLFVSSLRAQDPIFSQFYLNALTANPAFSGINYNGTLAMSLRNQWYAHNQGYSTMAVSYDQSIGSSTSVGGWMLADRVGDGILATYTAKGVAAKRISLDRNTYLKGGVEVGLGYMALNWDKLIFGDAINPGFGHITPGGTRLPTAEVRPSQSSNVYLDLGMGILFYTKRFYVGSSIQHLNRPNISFYKNAESKPLQVNVQAGMQISLSGYRDDRILLVPNIYGTYSSNSFQMTLGANYMFGKFYLGGWVRVAKNNGDAIIATTGIRYDNWKIGYSYDLTMSRLTSGTYGSHEIGISKKFSSGSSRFPKFDDCFEIFR